MVPSNLTLSSIFDDSVHTFSFLLSRGLSFSVGLIFCTSHHPKGPHGNDDQNHRRRARYSARRCALRAASVRRNVEVPSGHPRRHECGRVRGPCRHCERRLEQASSARPGSFIVFSCFPFSLLLPASLFSSRCCMFRCCTRLLCLYIWVYLSVFPLIFTCCSFLLFRPLPYFS